jgi:predicted 2-oxoglutarate/Fe(II)-dependent dioxygenase YbiX
MSIPSDQTFEENTSFTEDCDVNSVTTIASGEILNISSADLLSEEQCRQIIDTCIDELWMPCRVVGDENLHKGQRQKLKGNPDSFPFSEIKDITKTANFQIYDFNLLGIIDQDYPQVFKYSENDYYDLHVDINPLSITRKITFIIALDQIKNRKGGIIKFLNTDIDLKLQDVGSILIFPSFLPWKITPVEKGTARFVVGHIHGSLFK